MKKSPNCLIFAIAVMFFFLSNALAAEKVRLRNVDNLLTQLQNLKSSGPTDIAPHLGVGPKEELKKVKSRTDKNNVTHTRYAQLYNSIPVWGYHVIISSNPSGSIVGIHGTRIAGIEADIPHSLNTRTVERADKALDKAKQLVLDQNPGIKEWTIENETTQLVIYLDGSNTARISYFTSFFATGDNGKTVTRPMVFLDAYTLKTLHRFEGLTHADAGGPGGNAKTGKYIYGADYPHMEVSQVDNTCTMDNTNVKTINLDHGTSNSIPYDFTCYENTVKPINGAYSPLNDAHYFGGVVSNMFIEWFNTTPLTSQLIVRVHYASEYENAFWNGENVSFGDGADTFYPLVALDLMAHEVSHGFTEQNSALVYENQPGGINEAFSDMAGEAAEYYSRGTNDFLVASEVTKSDAALRYMEDPTLDGKSIGHIDDYTENMNVHYSSGVFNKAFYVLAHKTGWNTQKAFEIFVKANRDYWESYSTFQTAAEDVLDAAMDLGFAGGDVKDAFGAVGIALDVTPGPVVTEIQKGQVISDLSAEKGESLDFFINIPEEARNLTIQISGGSGDADLYAQFQEKPTTTTYDCRPFRFGNIETCMHETPTAGKWYISLIGYDNFSGVSLTADYDHIAEVINDQPLSDQSEEGKNQWKLYYIDVPENVDVLMVELSGGTGDVDLYTRYETEPNLTAFDCRPYREGNDEMCTVTAPPAGRYYIGLNSFEPYADVTLTARYE